MAAVKHPSSTRLVAVDECEMLRSPYTWRFAKSPFASIEAVMPGAYLKVVVSNTSCLSIIIDGAANIGCPAESMPVLEYSVNHSPFKIVPLSQTGGLYLLPIASDLSSGVPVHFELYFRASDLSRRRWTSTESRLRIAGLQVSERAAFTPPTSRTKRAIAFGDSITEGVGVDSRFTSWQRLDGNNARATWLPLVCFALDAEYGQLASGGMGVMANREMPPAPETWSHYDAETSRLIGGQLSPEPDYVFCAHGTNDIGLDIKGPYVQWLGDIRAACTGAHIFCITPPLGVCEDQIRGAVQARNAAGDQRTFLIDSSALSNSFAIDKPNIHPTALAFDGVHPNLLGQAMMAMLTLAQVARCLDEMHHHE